MMGIKAPGRGVDEGLKTRVTPFFKVTAGSAKYKSAPLIIGRTTHTKLM